MHSIDPSVLTMTWQGFVLLNLASVIGLAFWTGRQAERIHNLQDRVIKLENSPQVVPVARLEEQLKSVVATVESLATDLKNFQASIFAQAIRHGSNPRN